MGRACSTNGAEENIGGKARRKETTRKTIKMDIIEIG
jgi:hypothetical protein